MDKKTLEPTLMDNMLESLTSASKSSPAELKAEASEEVNMVQLIADNIYGLLSEKTLTIEQIALLQALLQTVRL
tara:strand:- start:143 stop:364 length:222 start_codon:yes stop_codon:yes gene_type:complete